MDLAPIIGIQTNGLELKWDKVKLGEDVMNMFKGDNNDDEKEDIEVSIDYQVLYRQKVNDNDEEKGQSHWNVKHCGNVAKYDITCPEMKLQYVINNILQSPRYDVDFKGYIARWSSQYKGDRITLSHNNTKAILSSGKNQSLRAEYAIERGMIVKLRYTFFYPSSVDYDGIGVTSSAFQDFDNAQTAAHAPMSKYSYGLYFSHNTYQYYGECKNVGWGFDKAIPRNKKRAIDMIIDWRNEQCLLSFFRENKLLGPSNQAYSMKLPKLNKPHVWYPMASIEYTNNWFKIECVEC